MFKIFFKALICLIVLHLLIADSLASTQAPIESMLKSLFDKANTYQVLKEQNYTPPFKWAEKLGIKHRSYVYIIACLFV